jgi:hypothetical protein
MSTDLPTTSLRGVLLAFLYFEVTQANDTNLKNLFLFTCFYLIMIYGSFILGIDTNVITSAFLTKTVFTVIDERIKKKTESPI